MLYGYININVHTNICLCYKHSMKTRTGMINTKFSIVLLGSRGTTSEFENSYLR